MRYRLNRFAGYTPADCLCHHCLHYAGKNKPCLLERCCCEEEKRLAAAPPAATTLPPLRHRHNPLLAEPVDCGIRPECVACRIPAHGFLCHFADGSCLRYGPHEEKKMQRRKMPYASNL